ncbi:MAG: DNA alkylation repair protein [Thomasclavelia sp.]|nr:DNA alkylation repair protein [Thomasclavelia sp.]
MDNKEIKKYLFEHSDLKYKEFNCSLIPNLDNDFFIGVRIPDLRVLAKKIASENYEDYFKNLQQDYYEEYFLEGLVIGCLKNISFLELTNYLDSFIPKMNNWAICDSTVNGLKIIKKYKNEMIHYINKYLSSNKEYEIRFGLIVLLNYYKEEEYLDYIFKVTDNITSEYYYVMMGKAWLISSCFVNHPKQTMSYLKNNNLDIVTYNKSLQKIIESNKVNSETKEVIRKMKIKKEA